MLLKNNTLWVISDTSWLTCYSKTAAKMKSQRWPGPVSAFLAVHRCSRRVGGAADPAHLHCWAGTKPPQEQLLLHTLLIRREALMRMQGNSLHAELLLSKRLIMSFDAAVVLFDWKKSEYLLTGNGTINEYGDIVLCVQKDNRPPESTIFTCCFGGGFKTLF